MRIALSDDESVGFFSDQLLQVGNGAVDVEASGEIVIPDTQISNCREELTEKIYPNVRANYRDPSWLKERAILAPLNDAVGDLKDLLFKKLPGQPMAYRSVDTDDDSGEYPVEFLNACNPSGVASHHLRLKVGVPMMWLKNLDAQKLCNGTRLVVARLQCNVVEATILTGTSSGGAVFIPRIPISSSSLPFQLKRVQFPLRLCF